MGRVWIVGSLNVDLPWRVARHPAVGETVTGEALAPLPGGKGLNQAVAAARMQADVALVGVVGGDEDGTWLRSIAVGEGIDVSWLRTDHEVGSGRALIVVDEAGANTVTVDAGANARVSVVDLPMAAGDVVAAPLEVPIEAIERSFALARAVGATCVLNPSPIGAGAALCELADVLVVNEHEVAALAHAPVPDDPQEALVLARTVASGVQVVVVTLGAAGVVVAGPEELTEPGHVVEAVDTTGAGDCFLGVLAAGLAGGLGLAGAVDRANRAAAIAVTRFGTVPAMPHLAELR